MPDKPAHVLEIPTSLGRDVDRAREGRGPTPPMEAFFSDETLESMVPDAGPVRAETLAPISPAEAAARSTFDGTTLPKHPVTRRVIPAPYRRDRISGGHHGKTWQEALAGTVRPGCIVPDVGLVIAVEQQIRREDGIPVGMELVLIGAGGCELVTDPGARVKVFR